jgi:hypothetical protein
VYDVAMIEHVMWNVYIFLHLRTSPVMFSRVEALKIPDIEKTDCSMFARHVISVMNVTYVWRSL